MTVGVVVRLINGLNDAHTTSQRPFHVHCVLIVFVVETSVVPRLLRGGIILRKGVAVKECRVACSG
jgi:hypothetical protein